MEEELKKCSVCGREVRTLTKDGLCFACLADKHSASDDDEGTWFNKA